MDLCEKCGKGPFISKKEFNQHVKDHNDEPIRCTRCEKIFPNMRGLQVHFSAVHESSKSFECDQCMKSFSTKHNLIRHKLNHEEPESWVSCRKCRKTFPSYV